MPDTIDVYVETRRGSIGPVPVEPLGDGRYRLWFHDPYPDQGMQFGCTVEAQLASPDRLLFKRVVDPGPFRTVDMLIPRSVAEWEALRDLLQSWEAKGIHWETLFGGLLLISIPRSMDFDPIPHIRALRV
jgi:hypothetical protein